MHCHSLLTGSLGSWPPRDKPTTPAWAVSILSSRVARGRSDKAVKPTVETYTAVLPWYERADFQRMWELAHDRNDMPSEYEVWHASARAVMTEWLARGRALQIITIRSDEFLSWLEVRGLLNTAASRLKYVEERARGAGISQRLNAGVAADQAAETTAA